ncbi:MAG: PaaI family thioesterase [Candidatus Korobacteraceae bacterium]
MESYELRVRESFARQGMMKTLEAQLSVVQRGATEIRFPCTAAVSQQHGFVHAGAVTTVLDSACGYAALTVAPEGFEVLSVEFKVNLLAPATGDYVIARAQVKRAGKTLTICTADAFAWRPEGEKLVAMMLATMIIRPLER